MNTKNIFHRRQYLTKYLYCSAAINFACVKNIFKNGLNWQLMKLARNHPDSTASTAGGSRELSSVRP